MHDCCFKHPVNSAFTTPQCYCYWILYFSYIVMCALLMTLIMLFVSTDDSDDNCLVFFFYSFPLLCIALCAILTCMNGSKLTLQCIFFKYTQLEWLRCSSSLPLLIQAYFRQGVALQYLGRHADALAAFASGLAQDPKSLQLLVGMVEAAMKSPLRGELERSDQTPGRCHLPFVILNFWKSEMMDLIGTRFPCFVSPLIFFTHAAQFSCGKSHLNTSLKLSLVVEEN